MTDWMEKKKNMQIPLNSWQSEKDRTPSPEPDNEEARRMVEEMLRQDKTRTNPPPKFRPYSHQPPQQQHKKKRSEQVQASQKDKATPSAPLLTRSMIISYVPLRIPTSKMKFLSSTQLNSFERWVKLQHRALVKELVDKEKKCRAWVIEQGKVYDFDTQMEILTIIQSRWEHYMKNWIAEDVAKAIAARNIRITRNRSKKPVESAGKLLAELELLFPHLKDDPAENRFPTHSAESSAGTSVQPPHTTEGSESDSSLERPFDEDGSGYVEHEGLTDLTMAGPSHVQEPGNIAESSGTKVNESITDDRGDTTGVLEDLNLVDKDIAVEEGAGVSTTNEMNIEIDPRPAVDKGKQVVDEEQLRKEAEESKRQKELQKDSRKNPVMTDIDLQKQAAIWKQAKQGAIIPFEPAYGPTMQDESFIYAMNKETQRRLFEEVTVSHSRQSQSFTRTEERDAAMQLALLRDAQNNSVQPPVKQEQEIPYVQPAAAPERAGESQGSASGFIRHSSFYEASSSRARMKRTLNKPPALNELIQGDDDDDLKRRFHGNQEAYKEYISFKGKQVILDRGFDASLLDHGLISSMIQAHGWTEFCTHNDADSNWELIREFYANVNPVAQTTWVRGKTIKIDSSNLNTFLQTGEQEPPLTYNRLTKSIIPEAEKAEARQVAWTMCGKKPQYVRGPAFEDKDVRVEIKPFLDFYFAKIKPVTHTHLVSGISLRGLSDILLGRTINVGDIISKIMMKEKKGVLTHPNLIRRLCEQAEVSFTDFSQARAIKMGGPIPLMPWPVDSVFRYDLMNPPPEDPEDEQEGEQSQAPPPQPRAKKPRADKGKKRLRGGEERGEEQTINQGADPNPVEHRTQVPGTSAQPTPSVQPMPSQGSQFTDISQALVIIQEKQDQQMREWYAARLKERELEIKARLQAELEKERMRIEWEREKERENRKLQLELQERRRAEMADIIRILTRQAPQVPQAQALPIPPANNPPPANAPQNLPTDDPPPPDSQS